ncbi:MAG: ATP-dependent nuclease [Bacteroidales bacterium]
MYLSNLKLWNFRKYGIKGDSFENSEAGLEVTFNNGLNVLVGENNSGKTTIIDAIRYVLKTQSLEYIQIDENDFYQYGDKKRTEELKIECTFKGFSDKEAGHFLEWIGIDKDSKEYILKVWLYARFKDNQVYQYVRAGIDSEGNYLEGEAKNLLRVVYLKPLRDALQDMTHGKKSRLAQILKSHPKFKEERDTNGDVKVHKLKKDYESLKSEIDNYFKADGEGSEIIKGINDLLGNEFLTQNDSNKNANITLTGSELNSILKQLDLTLEENKSGLGTLNLLCIAAELLLYKEINEGLKLTLIEELEAHLHPQYQLRIIDYLNENAELGQFILSTHSITLASKIKLDNLIVCKKESVYPMAKGNTKLSNSDYQFLERFLDATKANMFFAQGLIIVEGDAENLLIPTIAEIIDRPLHKYGVSIVNVGSTAFKRYVNIFKRSNGNNFEIPISIVSDLDIRSIEYYNDIMPEGESMPKVFFAREHVDKLKKITEDINYNNIDEIYTTKKAFEDFISQEKLVKRFTTGEGINERLLQYFDENKVEINEDTISELRSSKTHALKGKWDYDNIKIFLPNNWTLEYEIACSSLYKYLAFAVEISKREKNNEDFILNNIICEEIPQTINTKYPDSALDSKEIYELFKPLMKGNVSKASTAQYLSWILNCNKTNAKSIIENDENLKYLVDAIYHVTKQKDRL